MSAYYGQVKGMANTVATRRGSSKSGIQVSAQSWGGSVIVFMKDDEVELQIADGSSSYGKLYFRGTLDELKKVLKK